MGTLHHSPDLVLEIHDLGRQPGRMKRLQRDVPAPEGIGDDVIGVPAASPIALDLMLESAGDGVLVTGTAQVEVSGQCGRCLRPISDPTEFDLMELFLYPEAEPDDEEASRVVGESIDIEPLIRDTMVLDLPFAPLCEEDCAGLCPECGRDLNVDPDHSHASAVDPRWAGLTDWTTGPAEPVHDETQE